MTRVLGVACLLLAASGAPAGGQVSLRYIPDGGASVRTLTIERTVTTLFGFPAAPDGYTFETERRANATQHVRERREPGWIVDVTVDSIRARRRPLDGAWDDLPTAGTSTGSARLQVDNRFRASVLDSRGTLGPDATRVLGAGVAGPGIGFPGGSVATGAPFPTGGTVQLVVALGDEGGIPLRRTVAGALELVVDSVATRELDELVYLSFRGALDPALQHADAESGTLTVALGGTFAGRLIWSRSWNAFVSGAVRFQVDGRVRVSDAGGQREAAASWDVRVTHQVRP